jgi:hypothetical protein
VAPAGAEDVMYVGVTVGSPYIGGIGTKGVLYIILVLETDMRSVNRRRSN